MNTPPALTITDLSFAYPAGPATVPSYTLDQVSLSVAAGERVGIIGANGCGKTTLLLTICGVLAPSSGTVAVFGVPVQVGVFQPEVGFVFQNPNDQLFCPTVAADVAFGPTNLGLPADVIAARVHAALATTRTAHLAERAPHHLSGGEKRLVALAGVLAMQPRLILLDEPEAHLDRRARREVLTLLHAMRETLLIASHDFAVLAEVCTRVVLLSGGRVVADDCPEAVLENPPLLAEHGLT